MNEKTYDTSRFIDPSPRAPGFHDAHCRVVWTPRDGEAVTITGPYLDGDSPTGAVTLGCGIEEALDALRITDLLDDDHLLDVCKLVNNQLLERPWAEIQCPEGTARIELVPF